MVKKKIPMQEAVVMEYLNSEMKIKIGVMGSAGGKMTKQQKNKAYTLGQVVARNDCILLTGGCPGLPYETARGAKAEGGLVVGISPGLSLEEHLVKYNSPAAYHDILIFTGSGLMGREITNIRSSDIVVIVGGRSGTLGEFAIAYDEGKLIGVLQGTGGISDAIDDILNAIYKKTGSHVIKQSDPEKLMSELLSYYTQHAEKPISFFKKHSWYTHRYLFDASL